MFRQCPDCGSTQIRRSGTRGVGVLAHFHVLSPYRCRDCNAHFRTISKKFYALVAVIVIATLLQVAVSGLFFLASLG